MSDLRFGRDRLGDPDVVDRLEWCVTNGIGGFACGTAGGTLTRRDHGLLFAALKPPLGPTLLLAKLAESLELDGARIELDTNRWASGARQPTGHLELQSFHLEDTVPTWTWALGDTRLEKRVWMEHGENTTYVQYRLCAAHGSTRLHLRALVNHREHRDLNTRGDWHARVEPATGGLRIEAFDGATPLWLLAPGAEIRPMDVWHRGFELARESELGFDSREDHFCAAEMSIRLSPGDYFTVIASTRRDAGTGEAAPLALASALLRRRAHERSVLDAWRRAHPVLARSAPTWVRQLVLAADAFLIERSSPSDPGGHAVSAGYPSLEERSRDALAALPGLTLATGRPEVARAILLGMAKHVDRGMLPRSFPDRGETPSFDNVDAALWFILAARATHEAMHDNAFLTEIYPVLEAIVTAIVRGTRLGIGVDPEDGLIRTTEPGLALTWMDARADGGPVTPRSGKPVEVNALWYNALTSMSSFARALKRTKDSYETSAARVEKSFARYWNASAGCLFDVIDGPNGPDASVRPNQLLAVSLTDSPLSGAQRRAVLETCGRLLLTSFGLRTLSPADPRFRGTMRGDRAARARAAHQGVAWTWLLPHYALASERVTGKREDALTLLDPLGDLVLATPAYALPELVDGEHPHAPRGGFASAWSVGEALRAYHVLAGEPRRARRRRTPRVLEAANA